MILVDTHVVIWLALDRTQISDIALKSLAAARDTGGLAIADVSLWEVAQAVRKGRVALESSVHEFLLNIEAAYHVLPLTGRVAERGTQFSKEYPRDPVDRIVGATALVHGLDLVTRDDKIRASGEVPCVW